MKKSVKGVPGIFGFGGVYGPYATNTHLVMGKRRDPNRHSPIDYARGVYGTPRHKRLHGQRRQACR